MAFSTFIGGLVLFSERRFRWHGTSFGVREVGYIFAYSGFIGVIIQAGLIGMLVKRLSEKNLVVIGFVTMAIGFGFLIEARSLLPLTIAITLVSLGSSVVRPCLTSLLTQNTPRERQGEALGLMQSIMSISQIAAPAISGLMIEHRLLGVWATMMTVFSVVGFILSR